MAQISEFSLIFMAMGVAIGHVAADAMGLVTLVGLITIAASTYMITWSHQLYRFVEPVLGPFERHGAGTEEDNWQPSADGHDVVIFGLGRYGLAIAEELDSAGLKVLGVDFNPVAVREARQLGFDVMFGDATDPEFIAHLPLAPVRWAISAVPEHDTGITHDDPRRSLIRSLHDAGFAGRTAVAVHSEDNAERLKQGGADLVLNPYRDAASQAASLVLGTERAQAREPARPAPKKEEVQ
ncbi:MAG: NAD-binding protein [Hyphomicrobiales bacterium]